MFISSKGIQHLLHDDGHGGRPLELVDLGAEALGHLQEPGAGLLHTLVRLLALVH